MHVWMEVTQDKYELPVAVADTAAELARLRGVSTRAIFIAMVRYKKKEVKQLKYIKVEIEK